MSSRYITHILNFASYANEASQTTLKHLYYTNFIISSKKFPENETHSIIQTIPTGKKSIKNIHIEFAKTHERFRRIEKFEVEKFSRPQTKARRRAALFYIPAPETRAKRIKRRRRQGKKRRHETAKKVCVCFRNWNTGRRQRLSKGRYIM